LNGKTVLFIELYGAFMKYATDALVAPSK